MDTCRRPKGPKEDEATAGPRRERGETASGRRNIPVNAVLKSIFPWNLVGISAVFTGVGKRVIPFATTSQRVTFSRLDARSRPACTVRGQVPTVESRSSRRNDASHDHLRGTQPQIPRTLLCVLVPRISRISTGFFFAVGPCLTEPVRENPHRHRTSEYRVRSDPPVFRRSSRRRRPHPMSPPDDLNLDHGIFPISADLKLTPSLPSLHPPPIARARREPLFCVRRGEPRLSRRRSGRLQQRRRQHRYRRLRSQADWLSHGSHRGSLRCW